jgi:hypothetical protein
MGAGLWEGEFVTKNYAPTILACGENDRDVITKEGTPLFLKRLKELDVNHISFYMEGLGHSLSYGYDKKLGVDRYQLVMDFFDRYLKVKDKLPPVVLLTIPKDSAVNVRPSQEIIINFAPVINTGSVLDQKGIRLIRLTANEEIKGDWKVTCQGTEFTFKPHQPLVPNEKYRLEISDKIKDTAGNKIGKKKTIEFTVGTAI